MRNWLFLAALSTADPAWAQEQVAALSDAARGAEQVQAQPPLTSADVKSHIVSGKYQEGIFPPFAKNNGINGSASALCTISPSGALTDCVIQTEEPKGQEFGAALLRLARLIRIEAHAKDGSPTAGR
jgi:hypothetical protein